MLVCLFSKFDINQIAALIMIIGFHILTPTTAWKVLKYGVFAGPCFTVFGLNTGIHEIRENTDQKNSVFRHFSRSGRVPIL